MHPLRHLGNASPLTNWKLDERKEHVAYVMLDCAYKEADA